MHSGLRFEEMSIPFPQLPLRDVIPKMTKTTEYIELSKFRKAYCHALRQFFHLSKE